jgi:hypothetical protein
VLEDLDIPFPEIAYSSTPTPLQPVPEPVIA